MNNPKLMQYEQDILKSHLQNLQKPKQEMFIEKYKLMPDEDKEIVLQQIASQTPEFLELAKGEQPQLEFKSGGKIEMYQQGGTKFDGDTYVDKYGNTIIQRGNLDRGVGLSMAPEIPVKTEVPVSTKIDVAAQTPAVIPSEVVSKSATVNRKADYDNQGASRDEVKQMQVALKQAGFDPGPIDGLQGKRTNAALKRAEAEGFGIYKNDKGYEIVGRTKSTESASPSMLKFTATDSKKAVADKNIETVVFDSAGLKFTATDKASKNNFTLPDIQLEPIVNVYGQALKENPNYKIESFLDDLKEKLKEVKKVNLYNVPKKKK